jgi:hypothetical protein
MKRDHKAEMLRNLTIGKINTSKLSNHWAGKRRGNKGFYLTII